MSKRILVTGGAGFIGSHVVDELVDQGHEVMILDDLSGATGKWINRKAIFYRMSVASFIAYATVKLFSPHEVWHLAANAREGGSWFQPENVVRRNSYGVTNILEAAIAGGDLERFVFFSSMSVYGDQEPPFREDMEPKPENPYAVSKYAAERYVSLLADLYGFKWVIIRPHNVFGERVFRQDKLRNVVAIFANQILLGEPIYIYGDGQNLRAHSYIYDCIGPIMKAGQTLENEIINIGGEQAFTIQETADLVIDAMGKDYWPIEYLPGRYREVPFAFSDHAKARNLIDFHEEIGAEVGIARVCEEFAAEGPVKYVDVEPLTLSSEKMPETWK